MELPNHIVLTNSEITEIRNSDAKKHICDLEKQKIIMQEEIWLNNVSERLQLDARRYRIDIKTGICLLVKPEDVPNGPGDKNGVASPERVSETKPEQILDKPQA